MSTTFTIAACALVLASAAADAGTVNRIERYCTTSWQNAGISRQDWTDCTQEALLELLQRIEQPHWQTAIENSASEERRELNRTVWCIAQRWRRAPRHDHLTQDPQWRSEPAQDEPESIDNLLEQATLTTEQRQILSLWTEGHSVAEISKRLKMPAPRISDLKFKALQKLRESVA